MTSEFLQQTLTEEKLKFLKLPFYSKNLTIQCTDTTQILLNLITKESQAQNMEII